MVEAPGTAPGSTTLIPRTVYRHSRRTSPPNIGSASERGKGASCRAGSASLRERVRRRLTHMAVPRTLGSQVASV